MKSEISVARKSIKVEDCGEELVIVGNEFAQEPIYFNQKISDTGEVKLRSGIIDKLREAQQFLRTIKGCEEWNLKIWDGYRVLDVQRKLYEDYFHQLKDKHPDWDDERIHEHVQIFVTEPSFDTKSPSPHNTGAAIDLTLVDDRGEDVDMGTPFDEFTPRAYTDHFVTSDPAIHENRMILREAMESAGFENYPEEWWHFSFGDQFWAYATGKSSAIYGSVELN